MAKNVRPNRRREPKLKKMDRQGWKSLGGAALIIAATCVFAVGLPYGAYMYYRHLAEDGYFAPKDVTIQGNVRADDRSILEASGLEMENANLFEMDVRTIESSIETLPWVKEARVTIDLPDRAEIEITEHDPLGIVSDGSLNIVDEEGVFIKHWTEEDALSAPVVSIDRTLAERSSEIVRAFRIAGLAHRMGYERRIHEIQYDAATGYTLYTADTEIRLGYDRFDERIERLMEVEDVLESRRVAADYILIDGDDDLSRIVVKPKFAHAGEERTGGGADSGKSDSEEGRAEEPPAAGHGVDHAGPERQKPVRGADKADVPGEKSAQSADKNDKGAPAVKAPEAKDVRNAEQKSSKAQTGQNFQEKNSKSGKNGIGKRRLTRTAVSEEPPETPQNAAAVKKAGTQAMKTAHPDADGSTGADTEEGQPPLTL